MFSIRVNKETFSTCVYQKCHSYLIAGHCQMSYVSSKVSHFSVRGRCYHFITILYEKITETVNTVYIHCQDAANMTSCLFNYHTFLCHKHDVMFTALIIKILSHKSRKNSVCMSRTNQSSSSHSCLYRQQ